MPWISPSTVLRSLGSSWRSVCTLATGGRTVVGRLPAEGRPPAERGACVSGGGRYVARQLAHASLSEVGRAFGGKDHTTVLHAVDKVQTLLHEDPKLRKTIDGLIQGITL